MRIYTTVDASHWVITFLCIKQAESLVLKDWTHLQSRNVLCIAVVGELALDLNFLKGMGFNLVKIDTHGEILPTPNIIEAWLALLTSLPKRSSIFLIADRRLAITLTAVALLGAEYTKDEVEIVLNSILGSEFNHMHRNILTALKVELEDRRPQPEKSCCELF
mmetsp:Transcript_16952/g.30466  ORF Transcript_16952/g.30466 Transcript_16952/m.30466 type:complete len:163 (-) Transcript_16952:4117-4605(-)